MLEKNLAQRLTLIGVIVLVAVLLLFNYDTSTGRIGTNLRPGLDIAGGVSLIFEINDEGMESNPRLAEDMKTLLQKRVDPKGVYDLQWRVHGTNRIEVQMPLPPREVKELRDAYDAARKELYSSIVGRGDIEAALGLPAAEREARLVELAGGAEERLAAMRRAAEAFDRYQQALTARQAAQAAEAVDSATTQPDQRALDVAVRDAEEDLDDAVEVVRATNFPVPLFEDLLDKGPGSAARTQGMADLTKRFPELTDKMAAVVDTHDKWAAKSTYLDGASDLRRLLRGAGVLTFRILAEPDPVNLTRYDRLRQELNERGPRLAREEGLAWFRIDDPVNFFNLRGPAEIKDLSEAAVSERNNMIVGRYAEDWYVLARTDAAGEMKGDAGRSWQLQDARRDRDEMGRPSVNFFFDSVGGREFSRLTGDNVGRELCVFVDDVAYSAARIQERIGSSGRITGDFSEAKVTYLIQTMKAGALPARLKDTPISERTLGSSLGEANLHKAFRAGVVGIIAVAAVMGLYYLWAGMIANVALCLNIVLVLAAMSLLEARITLAGIAGIILTMGMAVDANVLIFERMREERERGSSLRMVIKNGYDKALSVIVDSNITTMLTCVILYYVGSEEVKGFGLTLGWGIATSLFTALFVTRTLFALGLKYHLIKDIRMLRIIGVPNIDWYAKRKFFIPTSVAVVVVGMFLVTQRGCDALDVEFRGGVNAEFELVQPVLTGGGVPDDIKIAEAIRTTADAVTGDAERLGDAEVVAVPGEINVYRVVLPGMSAARLSALIAEPLEDAGLLTRGGVDTGAVRDEITISVRGETSQEQLTAFVHGLAAEAPRVRNQLQQVSVSSVQDLEATAQPGAVWSITTTVTNKRLVQHVLETAMGDNLRRQPSVNFRFQGSGDLPYAITARRLGEVIPNLPPAVAGRDVTNYLDGTALYFQELDPPQSAESLTAQIRNMRLQPDYQDLPWREFEVVGVTPTGQADMDGHVTCSSVIVLVTDPATSYQVGTETWATAFAQPERQLVEDTLRTEQSLRKVSQFKPQVAVQAQLKAIMALMLSWSMIIGYMWLRFGRVSYGLAGVAALVHDVLIALAFVGISGWIGGMKHPIGNFFLIEDFHINMTVVAAFLTIIGYSINDTIVVFDRIREIRGRMGTVTPDVINRAINQTLARTIMTSGTTLLVLLVMYILGGSSIRGFNYCVIIGILTGTYSSIAVAAPLLLVGMRQAERRAVATAPAPTR
jgi:SecD/SecF fusion protein